MSVYFLTDTEMKWVRIEEEVHRILERLREKNCNQNILYDKSIFNKRKKNSQKLFWFLFGPY